MRSGLIMVGLLAACRFEHGQVPSGTDSATPADAPGSSIIDASGDGGAVTCSMPSCTAAGGMCSDGTCQITAPNGQPVTCPVASQCTVSCLNNNSSCAQGLSCPLDATCAFTCEADHTCDSDSTLTCAAGSTCEVFCKGDHACNSFSIACAAGATCIYHCCGDNACGSFTCNGAGCIDGGPSCP